MEAFKILVLSYNHPELTAKTVRSVLALDRHQKIMLIHNGSQAVNVERLKKEFPDIEHFELADNLGYSGGLNAGLAKCFSVKVGAGLGTNSGSAGAACDWAVVLTNDCKLEKLPNLTSVLSGFYAGMIFWRKTERLDSAGGKVTLPFFRIGHCRSLADFRQAKLKYIPGSAFVLHKGVFAATGGFDVSLGTYWEDVELSLRVQKQGLKLGVLEDFIVRHEGGKTCHKWREYTLYLFQRNRLLVARRYLTAALVALTISDWLLSNLRLSLRLCLAGRRHDLNYLYRALRDGLSASNRPAL